MTRGFLSTDLPNPFDRTEHTERGELTYDERHVCTVHGATVVVDRSVEPTESGSYYYRCTVCRAGGWSGL